MRPSPRVWYSSAEVVIVSLTLLPPSTGAATSWYSSSRHTSTVAPQSRRIRSSSRSLFIGLTATAIPPAFHVPSIAMTNCGTFCRNSATRSPAASPESASPAANALDRSSTSRRVSAPSK